MNWFQRHIGEPRPVALFLTLGAVFTADHFFPTAVKVASGVAGALAAIAGGFALIFGFLSPMYGDRREFAAITIACVIILIVLLHPFAFARGVSELLRVVR